MADALNDPEWARILPALLMLKNHESGVAAIERAPRARAGDGAQRRCSPAAVAEGVLRAGLDVARTSLTMLVGPLLFAHLTDSVKLDEAFVDRAVDNFLKAYAPS